VVVARGQRSLLEVVRALAAEVGWIDVIEDRRHRPSLLPRGDRERLYADPAWGEACVGLRYVNRSEVSLFLPGSEVSPLNRDSARAAAG